MATTGVEEWTWEAEAEAASSTWRTDQLVTDSGSRTADVERKRGRRDKQYCGRCKHRVNPVDHASRCRPAKETTQRMGPRWSGGYCRERCDGMTHAWFCRDSRCLFHAPVN